MRVLCNGARVLRGSRAHRWFSELAWHWIAIVLLSAAAIAGFAKVGEDVFMHESAPFDDAIRGWVLAHQWRPMWTLFLWITNAGATGPMVVLALATAVWMWRRSHRRIAAVVITAPAIAVAIGNAIKFTYQRVRPSGALEMHITTYAFPSGHTTASTAVLVTMAYVLTREGKLHRAGACVVGILGPLLVGLSRIYLDVHWATDVLGGWALGAIVACISAALYEDVRRKLTRGRAVVNPFGV